MNLYHVVKGLIIGFSIAAPVGPIGILCIQRTLNKGRKSGFCSGMGAASADAIYGFLAGFGITAISGVLLKYQSQIRIIGGMFLIYLGLKALLSKPPERAASAAEGPGIAGDFLSTLLLTITNPATIISFAGIFAGFGIVEKGTNYISAASLVIGVFTGSLLWWLLLSTTIDYFKKRFNFSGLKWVNIASGLIIIIMGMVSIFSII